MRKGACKHFNGIQSIRCDAGVRYDSVIPEPLRIEGKAIRVPCHTILYGKNHSPKQLEEFAKRGTCDKYEEPSEAELKVQEEHVKRAQANLNLMLEVVGKIKKEQRGKNWQGTVECPICHKKLFITHASCNSHVWGRCETEGCLAWME